MRRELNFAKGSLSHGGIGVLPTDTLYGLVASALSEEAVERVYAVRGRTSTKPLIILISSIDDLRLFGIYPNERNEGVLKKVWPGPVSVILPCTDKKFEYLHRGACTLAFRVPRPLWLRGFLKKTGPLVAPSANPEGKHPARNREEAQQYFRNEIDFYCGGDELVGEPSTLIEIKR